MNYPDWCYCKPSEWQTCPGANWSSHAKCSTKSGTLGHKFKLFKALAMSFVHLLMVLMWCLTRWALSNELWRDPQYLRYWGLEGFAWRFSWKDPKRSQSLATIMWMHLGEKASCSVCLQVHNFDFYWFLQACVNWIGQEEPYLIKDYLPFKWLRTFSLERLLEACPIVIICSTYHALISGWWGMVLAHYAEGIYNYYLM